MRAGEEEDREGDLQSAAASDEEAIENWRGDGVTRRELEGVDERRIGIGIGIMDLGLRTRGGRRSVICFIYMGMECETMVSWGS